MAAPLGPPPSIATTRTLPSGVTRESVRRSISTRITEPSGMATGPSGKRSPDAICLTDGWIVFDSIAGFLSSACGAGEQSREHAHVRRGLERPHRGQDRLRPLAGKHARGAIVELGRQLTVGQRILGLALRQ